MKYRRKFFYGLKILSFMIETQDGYCGGSIREWHYMKYKGIDHCIF